MGKNITGKNRVQPRARKNKINIFLFLAILLSPLSIGAQVLPYRDPGTWRERGINMIAWSANWIATTRSWSQTMRSRTQVGTIQAEIQRRIRRKAEDRAIGELGRLGEAITNKRDREDLANRGMDEYGLSQLCGVAQGGTQKCASALQLRRRYEKVLSENETKYTYEDPEWLAGGKTEVQERMRNLLGPSLQEAMTGVQGRLGGPKRQIRDSTRASSSSDSMDRSIVVREPGDLVDPEKARTMELVIKQGERAAVLGLTADSLDAAVSRLALGELSGTISSGRARQIEMLLVYQETKVQMQLLQTAIQGLETYLMTLAADVRDIRKNQYVALIGTR